LDRDERESRKRSGREQAGGYQHQPPVHVRALAPSVGGGEHAGKENHVVERDAEERGGIDCIIEAMRPPRTLP
jgi:hypothetical protein